MPELRSNDPVGYALLRETREGRVTTVMEPHMRQAGGLAQRAPRAPPRCHRPRRVQLPALPMPRKEEMVRLREAERLRALVQFAEHGETGVVEGRVAPSGRCFRTTDRETTVIP